LNLYRTAKGEDVQKELAQLITDIQQNDNIHVHLNTEIANVEGFVGNFKTTLAAGGQQQVLEHGVAIMATGGRAYQPKEYTYGTDPRIVTSLELDRKIMDKDPALKALNSAVFIQCVGSREPALLLAGMLHPLRRQRHPP
jgi:heterodisulfide reductase subunit A